MGVTVLTQANFDEVVTNSKVPVLVDFYADWCGPCKAVAPILAEIAAENADTLLVCKVDVDQDQALAIAHGVMSIPCLLTFKDGAPYKRAVGAIPKEAILALAE